MATTVSGSTSETTPPDTIDRCVRVAAGSRPSQLALADAPNREQIFGGDRQRLSWDEVHRTVQNLASTLTDMGVGRGDRVAVQLPNVVELPLTILACARLGAIAVPFPIQHRQHELSHGLSTSGAELIVSGVRPDRDDVFDTIREAVVSSGCEVRVAGFGPDLPATVTGLELSSRIDQSGMTEAVEPPEADEVATICWTSGTTGTPKGVPRTNAMWLASGDFQVSQLGLTADDNILCPFPVVNMAGIGGMLVPWAMVGGSLFLHQPLDLPVFLQQLAGEAISYTVAPPALLNMLLSNEEMLEGLELPALRMISSGSAPLDPWMVEEWEKRGIEIVNVFGSNEGASMLSTAAMVPDPSERARYFPRPDREGVRTRLVDLGDGEDITDAGVPGELRFTGRTVFHGYLDSDGSEFDDQGYYRTGDLFEWVGPQNEASDASPRLLRFVDRAKDIIIRGGMNISAAEVEGLVSSHESIVECAAVAFPDTDLGEKVGVFVVAAPDAEPTLEVVVDHLRAAGVASYKLPEKLEIIDTLPRNPVGKVTKPDLRARWT